jgi:guanylate kinase
MGGGQSSDAPCRKIVLAGKAGAGKTYAANLLGSHDGGRFQRSVSYTTRPSRDGEEHGDDYWFVTDEEFDRIDMYESTSGPGARYGTSTADFEACNVFVMDASGLEAICAAGDRELVHVIYFDTSDDVRAQRLQERGWTATKISLREAHDDKMPSDGYATVTLYDSTVIDIVAVVLALA